MARFEQLNSNIYNVMMELITSQNLCKLLYHNSYNPLNESDILDTSSLLFDKVYPLPKIPDIESEASSFLSVMFDNFRLGDSVGVKEGLIMFTVICHIDLWTIEGGIRPFAIMAEIDKMFNDERKIGIKRLQFDRGRFISVNESYAGYQVTYQIVSVN